MSNASLNGTCVYKLFTSRDITFSLGLTLMLSKISLASSQLVSMFAPSICQKVLQDPRSGYNKSYSIPTDSLYAPSSSSYYSIPVSKILSMHLLQPIKLGGLPPVDIILV